jgi:exosortase A
MPTGPGGLIERKPEDMSAVPADLRIASPWRTALPALAGLLLAIGLLYRDTASTMVGIWLRSDTFAHCLLVLPISLWLIWRQRQRLAMLSPRAQPWVLLPLLAVAAFWLLADLVVVNAATQFAFVAMLVLAVPAVLGFEVTRAILFPLLFLFFGVPFGEFALPTLMEWTADFVVFALQLTGIPVYREGQHFVIPSGSWSVIDECSGVRYVMASFMVGSLFAYLNYRSYKRRAVFMLVSLVVPVVANWLRAYMIVMLAHLSGNKIAVGVDHILYGWVFFGIIILVMFMIGARWSEPEDSTGVAGAAGGHAAATVAGSARTRSMLGTAAAAVVTVMLPHLFVTALESAEGAAIDAVVDLPVRLSDGWSSEGAQLVKLEPTFKNPSAEARKVYTGPAGTVGVHVAYVRGQTEDRKIVTSRNSLVGMRDSEWNLPQFGSKRVALDGRTIEVRTAMLLGRDSAGAAHRPKLMVWRLYWIDGRFIGGDARAKLANALARLRGRGDEGALILLYADDESTARSNAAIEAFLQANASSLNAALERTRSAR